ncbi:MAG: sigma-54-dependent Fis family transcriptional regulator [Spirochaetaceae bacterium]|nr:MAG: sigma-54-dependent Fis family transcriptional regulator [Spirochaetaceae bacterium]
MLAENVDLRRLDTLIEINTLINSDYSDPNALLTRIVESATRLTEGEASSLLLINPDDNKLYFEVALGSKGPEVQRFSLNPGEGIAGWVVEKNRSLIVNDVETDQRFFSNISKAVGFSTRNILAAPMRIRDKCVGVLEILNKKERKDFTESDLWWLEIFANQAALAIQNARSFQKAREQIDLLSVQVTESKGYHTLVAMSPAMLEKIDLVKRVAPTDSSVLILGESGVGKELFAEQLHLNSRRADRAFVRVNCAALPESLLESELFGHVKGAFTDANRDRIGRFELADGGTIFLDEIGELPLSLQAKLLRVLQERTFEKVGASEPISVDVRIVAATNRDIEEEVSEGRFRRDLYYRLNVLPLYVPPLRSRPEDIPELAQFFLKRLNHETKKQIRGFSDEAMEQLLSYSWPGNVRELENAVERAVVISRGDEISPDDLVLQRGQSDGARYEGNSLKDAVNMFKKQYLRATLGRCEWNQTVAARQLGIQRTYLSRLIKELDISRSE